MDKKEKIITELMHRKEILESKGYSVIYIGLYGSQNYNLDDEESDIDAEINKYIEDKIKLSLLLD